MKILGIVGSPRSAGNTSYLVGEALEEAERHGFETEKIMLGECRVGPCLGHENCGSFPSCRQDDDAPWILEKFRDAEGIILGSPVYYYGITAQMKAFVDRNYFLFRHGIPLKARCAGLVVVAGGGGIDHTVRALRRFVKLATSMPDERIVTLTAYASRPGEVKGDLSAVEDARKLGTRMAEILTSQERSPA